jgi:hypothetical protein
MKVLLIATLLMSMSAFAEEKNENFATKKAAISANIDQRLGLLQSHKNCVASADNNEALHACRKTNKEAMKKLHVENKGEREEWKAGKEGRKDKRKADKKAEKSN